MKKMFMTTVALVALGSTVALADSMNLGWACRTSANNGNASTNNVDPTAGGTVDCNDPGQFTGTRRIIASFKNTSTLLAWGGTTVRITVLVYQTPIPDYWNVSAAGCRAGSLTAPSTLVGAASCTNPYTIAPVDPQGQTNQESVAVDAANGRIRYEADHFRNTTQVDIPPPVSAGGYIANNIGFTVDAVGPDLNSCAGCDVPACIILDQVDYFSLTEKRSITTPELRGFITWVDPYCRIPDPTRGATWGAVKALYR